MHTVDFFPYHVDLAEELARSAKVLVLYYFGMLKKIFHHFFVPGEHNEYHPHLLRPYMFFSFILVAVFLFGLSLLHHAVLTKTDMFASIYPQVLAQLTNEDREQANLDALKISPTLEKVAQLKVQDMAEKGYFAHNSPDGVTPWHWFSVAGYSYEYAGENLAIDFSDSEDVDRAWMNSPTHRANILNHTYTEVGIATARGTFEGKDVVFVAQEFGTPKKTAPNYEPKFAIVEKAEASTEASAPSQLAGNVRIEVNNPKVAKASEEGSVSGAVASEEPASFEDFVSTTSAEVSTEQVESKTLEKPSFWAFLVSNPQHTLAFFYFLMAGSVFIALLLLIFIEVSHHHVKAAVITTIFLICLLVLFVAYRHFILQSLMVG